MEKNELSRFKLNLLDLRNRLLREVDSTEQAVART